HESLAISPEIGQEAEVSFRIPGQVHEFSRVSLSPSPRPVLEHSIDKGNDNLDGHRRNAPVMPRRLASAARSSSQLTSAIPPPEERPREEAMRLFCSCRIAAIPASWRTISSFWFS